MITVTEVPVVKEQWSYANQLDFLSLFRWKIRFDKNERAYKLPEPLVPDKFCPMIDKEIPSAYCEDCNSASIVKPPSSGVECRYGYLKPQHTVSCVKCGRKTVSKYGICLKCKQASRKPQSVILPGLCISLPEEQSPKELFIQLTEVPIVQPIASLDLPLQEVVRTAIFRLIAQAASAVTPSEIAKNENIIRLIKESRAASNQKDEGRQIIYIREINRRCNQLLKQGLIQDVSGRTDITTMGKFVKA